MLRRNFFLRFRGRREVRKINTPVLITLGILTALLAVMLVVVLSSKSDREAAVSPILAKGILRIGLREDIPGFTFTEDNGTISGFEADVGAEIARRLISEEIPIEILGVNSKSARLMINSGDIDLALGAFIDNTDSKIVFSTPYFTDKLVFLSQGVSKLQGGVIGVIAGSYADANLKKYFTEREIEVEIKRQASMSDALESLQSGRLTAICDGSVFLHGMDVGSLSTEGVLPHGYCVMISAKNDNMLKAVNEIIAEMNKDGTLTSLINKWKLSI